MRATSIQIVPSSVPSAGFRLATATLLAALVVGAPKQASACGGPCAVPELWSLQPTSQGVTVVTNFGLIGRDQEGWILACEEHIGGILLDVKASDQWLVALTDSGVWLSHDGVCSWEKGPTSERSSWFLDSAVGPASQGVPPLLVLANDAVAQHTNLERSNGAVFDIVRSFDSAVAFRNLVASPSFQQIFVTGYSQGPRTWHLSYSLNAGERWSDVVPPEVDNAGANMVPKRVDPNNPTRLFLAAQTPSGGGDQLWMFDTVTDQTRLLVTLDDGEVLSNLAFLDGQVWLAGRRNGAGSLYRAEVNSLEFTRVKSDAPSLACLETNGSSLLACANDFSYESTFLVAEVDASDAAFSPQMRVADLVNLRACDDKCAATQDWLTTTYGSATPNVDAGATDTTTETATTADEPTTPVEKPRPSKSNGCGVAPGVSAALQPAVFALLALVAARLRRRS